MAEKLLPSQVRTGVCRLSFLHVFEPKQVNGKGDPKYSAKLLIPKKDKETLEAIQAAIDWVIANNQPTLAGKTKGLQLPLNDGDDGEDESAHGHFYLNAKANVDRKPKLFNEKNEPIEDREDLYSGCYGKAIVNFYAFDARKSGGKLGVSLSLQAIKKIKDGEPLASVFTEDMAKDAFGEEAEDSLLG